METFEQFCGEAQKVDLTADDYDLGQALKKWDLCVGEEGHDKAETRAALLDVMVELSKLRQEVKWNIDQAEKLLVRLDASNEEPTP